MGRANPAIGIAVAALVGCASGKAGTNRGALGAGPATRGRSDAPVAAEPAGLPTAARVHGLPGNSHALEGASARRGCRLDGSCHGH